MLSLLLPIFSPDAVEESSDMPSLPLQAVKISCIPRWYLLAALLCAPQGQQFC
jgi:hypothetical protein